MHGDEIATCMVLSRDMRKENAGRKETSSDEFMLVEDAACMEIYYPRGSSEHLSQS